MFDIYKPSTYSEAPKEKIFINGEPLFDEKNNRYITVKEIVDIINSTKVFLCSRNPGFNFTKYGLDRLLANLYHQYAVSEIKKRKIQEEKRKELIHKQLENLSKITKRNKFNPRDENTFKYAKSDVITVIDGIPIYDLSMSDGIEKKTYIFETDYVQEIKIFWDIETECNTNLSKEKFIKNFADVYVIRCKDNSIKMSDLIINGYNYSNAQKEMTKHLSQEDLIKLTDIIIKHFENKEKKYKLQQDIFDSLGGKLDNYLFTDLCYAKDSDEEQKIMDEYYSALEED